MPKRQRVSNDVAHPPEDVVRNAQQHDTGLEHVSASQASVKKFHAYICDWRSAVGAPDPVHLPSRETTRLTSPQTLLALMTAAAPRSSSPRAPSPSSSQQKSTGTGIVYDIHMAAHVSADPKDFERPARLERTVDHLDAVGLLGLCERLTARGAKTRELRRAHSRDHIDYVDNLEFFMSLKDVRSEAVGQDLYASSETSKAARHAAGCSVEAALAVASGRVRNAFALVRPPGHHAGTNTASGFCFFNNVAVAARAAQEALRTTTTTTPSPAKPRILILDWDVHHCDGTENIFHDDDSVLVVSLHQYRKGHPHVLRKTPSALTSGSPAQTSSIDKKTTGEHPEEVDVDTLAGLLFGDDSVAARDAAPTPAQALPTPVPPPEPTSTATSNAHPAVGPGVPRRARKAVDYNKLAEELHVDDAAAAQLFHTRLTPTTSGSSSSSASSSSGSDQDNAPAVPGQPPAHYAGDSEGLSVDRFSNDDGDRDEKGGTTDDDELFYPGTGHLDTVGGSPDENPSARGKNMNIPWPSHGMGDLEYLYVLSELVLPVAEEFAPEMVLLSAGFDSCQGDLLGSMNLSPSGFYAMTKALLAHFPRLVAILEGGYNVANVARCSEAVLRALLEDSRVGGPTPPLPPSRMLLCQAEKLVGRVKAVHKPYWTCLQSGDRDS